jgi:hypothetical protein
MNGDRVLTIRPFKDSSLRDKFRKTSEEEVVLSKEDYTFSVNFDNGFKYI